MEACPNVLTGLLAILLLFWACFLFFKQQHATPSEPQARGTKDAALPWRRTGTAKMGDEGQLKALSAAAFNHMHLMIMICLQGMSDAKVPATRVECSQTIWAMENGDRKNKITQWHALSQKGHTGFTCSVQRPDAWWQRSLRLFSMSIARPRES